MKFGHVLPSLYCFLYFLQTPKDVLGRKSKRFLSIQGNEIVILFSSSVNNSPLDLCAILSLLRVIYVIFTTKNIDNQNILFFFFLVCNQENLDNE